MKKSQPIQHTKARALHDRAAIAKLSRSLFLPHFLRRTGIHFVGKCSSFGENLDTCPTESPRLITTEGEDVAVLVSIREWQRRQREARPNLKDLLPAREPRADLILPERGRRGRRLPSACDATSAMA